MGLLDADELQREVLLGEDTVDLFTAIEESFGVEVCNSELLPGKSVQEIAAYIHRQLKFPLSQHCLSMVSFYQLRRSLISLYCVPREFIRPGTRLDRLFPWKSRRKRWSEIETSLNLTLPPLTYPLWLLFASVVLAALCSTAITLVLSHYGVKVGVVALAISTFVCWLPSVLLLIPMAQAFPKSCETVGDLVNLILACNYAAFAAEYGGSSEGQIVSLLQRLIAAEVGLDLTEVTSDTLVPQDLNIY